MNNAAWDWQIMHVMRGAIEVAKHKSDAKIAVTVDGAEKRDYFVRRLNDEIAAHPSFPAGIVFAVIPVDMSHVRKNETPTRREHG